MKGRNTLIYIVIGVLLSLIADCFLLLTGTNPLVVILLCMVVLVTVAVLLKS